jgi:hypothetical protein
VPKEGNFHVPTLKKSPLLAITFNYFVILFQKGRVWANQDLHPLLEIKAQTTK